MVNNIEGLGRVWSIIYGTWEGVVNEGVVNDIEGLGRVWLII